MGELTGLLASSLAVTRVGLLCALIGAFACGESSKPSPSAAAELVVQDVDAGPASAPPPSAHPPTADGLKAQIGALIAVIATGDEKAFAEHAAPLALPEPKKWFRDRFGAKRARALSKAYEPVAANPSLVAGVIKGLAADGLTAIRVEKFEKVDDLGAVAYQTRALKAMRLTDPIYSVRLANADQSKVFHLWSFVHAGERFRYVGKMKSIGKPDLLGDQDLAEFRPTDAARLRKAASSDR